MISNEPDNFYFLINTIIIEIDANNEEIIIDDFEENDFEELAFSDDGDEGRLK